LYVSGPKPIARFASDAGSVEGDVSSKGVLIGPSFDRKERRIDRRIDDRLRESDGSPVER
jgi:hypothetical protein